MPVAERIRPAVIDRLVAAGCVAADDEAVELLRRAPDEPALERWLHRREQGEPLAWITGSLVFGGQRLVIAPGVYVPRPHSEELARRAAALLPDHGRALDLCTGVGAIAAHLMAQVPTAVVIATDVDERVAGCARRNGVPTVVADLAAPLRRHARFDVITAVAPYVPTGELRLLASDVQRFEPRLALDGGADGLDVVRAVIAAAGRLLRPGGWLLAEVGGEQDQTLTAILAAGGFNVVEPWRDDDGGLRGVACRRSTVDELDRP